MLRRWLSALLPCLFGLALWAGAPTAAHAQQFEMNRFFYYPYYYFPGTYWPMQGPKWPEPVGQPYMRPPAYMAFPPFQEPYWRYDYYKPTKYYRGSHFLLDVF